MNYEQYQQQSKHYQDLAKRATFLLWFIAVVVAILLLVNRFWPGFVKAPQPFWFSFSLIACCVALIRYWQYKQLLNDRISPLYTGEEIYTLGKTKNFTERTIKNRNFVYNNNIFLWLAILFFAIGAFLWLMPANNENKRAANKKSQYDDGLLNLTIVQVNDVYEIAPLNNGAVGGMARVASLKKHYQQKNKNTLLLMAGDFLSPSVYNGIKKDSVPIAGMQMIEAMNAAGFDLAVFGNHEFDIAEQQLQSCIDESHFDWVSSTAFRKGNTHTPFAKNGNNMPQTWIKNFSDEDGTHIKIGFIGITVNDNKADYVTYDTSFEHIKKLNDQLQSSCDAVVALTHQNMSDDIALAKKLPGLAAIIGGHEHDFQFMKVGNVYITKAHSNARSAFILDFVFSKRDRQTKLIPLLRYIDTSIKSDDLTDAIVQKWSSAAIDYFRSSGFSPNSVVYNGEPFDGRDTEVRRNKNNNLAKMIVKAMENACPAASLAVFNAGAIRVDDMLPARLRQYDILRALPYPGTIQEVNIKGDALIKMLNVGMGNVNEGSFLQYSNSVQLKGPKWHVGITPVDSSAYYRIAMAQYLSDGKGKNPAFLKDAKPVAAKPHPPGDVRNDIRLAMISYLKYKK